MFVQNWEKRKLNLFGKSLFELGNTLQELELQPPQRREDLAERLYQRVYQQVCQFCEKKKLCWEQLLDETMVALRDACNELEKHGIGAEPKFSIKFQERCFYTEKLEIVLINQIEVFWQQQGQWAQSDEQKTNIAQQLMSIGEQLQCMRVGSLRPMDDISSEKLFIGHASIKKETISGDSWGVQELEDGRLIQILCDGMGSGNLAMQQSQLAVHVLQILLRGGLSIRLSLNILNTVLSFQYGGVRFSTIDVSLWNLSTKKIEFYKYGAAPSFVKHGQDVTTYHTSSLPMGILPRVDAAIEEHILMDGDILVMMSDGLYDLNEDGFQWETVIGCIPTGHPQLAAEYLLAIAKSQMYSRQKRREKMGAYKKTQNENTLGSEKQPLDDMTVLVSCLF